MVDTLRILKELVDTAVQILVLNQIYLTEKAVVMASEGDQLQGVLILLDLTATESHPDCRHLLQKVVQYHLHQPGRVELKIESLME